jgi:hypothetical protein
MQIHKSNKPVGYFTASMHKGLTHKQLLKLIESLPQDGLFVPHSILNDSDDLKQIFGLMYYPKDEIINYDEGDMESIDADLSTLFGSGRVKGANFYNSHNGRKFYLKQEKVSVSEVKKRNAVIEKMDQT